MKTENYMMLKEQLRFIEQNKSLFGRLEMSTECAGCSTIGQLVTLSKAAVEHTKDTKLFIDNPFEPATLSNMMSAMEDAVSTCTVFECMPGDYRPFDARDVLDIKTLNDVIDDLFRCTSVQLSSADMPRAVRTLDVAICDILSSACKTIVTFRGEPREDLTKIYSLTGNTSSGGLTKFTVLGEQKYFTKEEEQAKRDAEEAKAEAIRKAEEKEREVEENRAAHLKVIETLEKLIDILNSTDPRAVNYDLKGFNDALATPCKVSKYILNGLECAFRDGLETYVKSKGSIIGFEFVADGKITNNDMYFMAYALSLVTLHTIAIESDSGIVYRESYVNPSVICKDDICRIVSK